MVYAVYRDFASRNHTVMMSRKPIAHRAYQNLVEYELVKYVHGHGKTAAEFRMTKMMVEPQQVHEAVMRFTALPFAVKRWDAAC